MFALIKQIFGLSKKVLLVCVVFSVVIVTFLYFINQNRPRYDEKKVLQASQKQLYDVYSTERLNIKKGSGKDMILSIYRMGYCSLMGELCSDQLSYDNSHFKSSLLGQMTNLISMTYTNPPSSGTYWVRNTLQNAGFIPQSYAAEGMGFSMIKPIMNLWKIFRDIAYLVIVLFLVAIGFMIMFRTKINPQTVISVENSLPKIVVALLLITFSFAIAGFLIDLMYLIIILAIGILSNNNAYYDATKIQNVFLNSNIITLWDWIVPVPETAKSLIGLPRFAYIGDAFMALIPENINVITHIIAVSVGAIFGYTFVLQLLEFSGLIKLANNWQIAGFGVGVTPQAFLGIPMIALIGYILYQIVINGFGFIVGFIVSLAIFGMIFNIFFLLLRSYIQIIISIIFSPIILLFEAIPGKSTFSFWLKGLIGELITFPVVIVLLLVEKVMFMTMTYSGDFWTPPFLVNLSPGSFSVIIGLGLILVTPDIIKMVKDAIGAKPLPFNIGVGTFMSGGGAVVGGGMSILQQFSTMSLGMNALVGEQNIFKTLGRFRKERPPAPNVTPPNPTNAAAGGPAKDG